MLAKIWRTNQTLNTTVVSPVTVLLVLTYQICPDTENSHADNIRAGRVHKVNRSIAAGVNGIVCLIGVHGGRREVEVHKQKNGYGSLWRTMNTYSFLLLSKATHPFFEEICKTGGHHALQYSTVVSSSLFNRKHQKLHAEYLSFAVVPYGVPVRYSTTAAPYSSYQHFTR